MENGPRSGTQPPIGSGGSARFFERTCSRKERRGGRRSSGASSGSENASALGMLPPVEGIKGLKRFVVDAVIRAGAQPCPPTILGVAIGGSADAVLNLAKMALLKPIGEENNDPKIAALERELLEAANMTGIGPMGLGGRTTVLGVHLDYAFRHPASLPVAVAFNCWASRRASAKIFGDGKVEYLTHRLEENT